MTEEAPAGCWKTRRRPMSAAVPWSGSRWSSPTTARASAGGRRRS